MGKGKKISTLLCVIISLGLALVICELVLNVCCMVSPGFTGKLQKTFFTTAEKPHPYCGQQTAIVYSSAVRDDPGEYVILLVGGSAAFGVGCSTMDKSIPVALEKYLNTRNRIKGISRFKIVNATNPSYQSTQEKIVFMQFLSLGSPFDMLVSIGGFNDLARPLENYAYSLPLNYPGMPWIAISKLNDEPLYYLAKLLQSIYDQSAFKNSKTITLAVNQCVYQLMKNHYGTYIRDKIGSVAASLPDDAKQEVIYKGAGIYLENVREIGAITKMKGIKAIFVMQPLLGFDKDTLSPEEQKILDFRMWYDLELAGPKLWFQGYRKLQDAASNLTAEGIDFLDFTGIFKTESVRTFADFMHMNDRGQDIFADRLSCYILDSLGRARE